jgi:hypothetical protein
MNVPLNMHRILISRIYLHVEMQTKIMDLTCSHSKFLLELCQIVKTNGMFYKDTNQPKIEPTHPVSYNSSYIQLITMIPLCNINEGNPTLQVIQGI